MSISRWSTSRNLEDLPLCLPPMGRAELISKWLETSMDNIQVDYSEPDESVTTADTDISCSDGESEPDASSEEKSVLAKVPIPTHSESEPIQSTAVGNHPVASKSPVVAISNSETKSGFFVSLKRKATSFLYERVLKRPRREED